MVSLSRKALKDFSTLAARARGWDFCFLSLDSGSSMCKYIFFNKIEANSIVHNRALIQQLDNGCINQFDEVTI